MAEIALDCGYPASSLKERVFALSGPDGAPERCGILIYTAAPDLGPINRASRRIRSGPARTRAASLSA
jgi:hypothetical protein